MFILEIVLIHRCCDHKLILTKWNETAVWLVEGISNEGHIHAAVQNPCHSAKTVRLPGVEVYVRNLAGKGTGFPAKDRKREWWKRPGQ